MVDDFPLPIKIVSEDEKKRLESELRRPNKILKFHHQIAKKRGFLGNRRVFFVSVCSGSWSIPENDLKVILDAKNLEQDFLAIYSGIIFKISSRWSNRIRNLNFISNDDVCVAATEGFLVAFCSFTEEVRFSTYLTYCVNSHINRLISSFCTIPHKALKSKIYRLMLKEGVSFDSAIESMNLPERKKREVFKSMFEVYQLDELDKDLELETRKSTPEPELPELPELSKIEFFGLEKLVFQEFLNSGGEINLTSLSKNTINPKTNKPYSKMAMSLAWRRVRNRLFGEFSRVA